MDDVVTDRLVLSVPTPDDADQLFALYHDPLVWAADPLTRHDDPAQTTAMLRRWLAGWEQAGLGIRVARDVTSGQFVGIGGAILRGDLGWNIGFRLLPTRWGHGYATEIGSSAIAAARRSRPELPVTAYLLEGNDRSAATLARLGLRQVWRGPDAGNPDPAAVRLLYADGDLSRAVVDALTAT